MILDIKNWQKKLLYLSLSLLTACSPFSSHKSNLQDDQAFNFKQNSFSISGSLPLQQKWWLSFNDPQLNQLIEQALNSNYSLQEGLLKIKLAHLSHQSTEASQAFKLDASAGASNSQADKKQFFSPSGKITSSTDKFSLGLAASYEFDVWNKLSNQVKLDTLDQQSAFYDYQSLAISISAEIATAWFRLVEQYEQKKLLHYQLKISKEYLLLLEHKFRAGQVPAIDVLQQRQTVESVQGDLHLVHRAIQQYQYQLALLLSKDTWQYQITPQKLDNLPKLPQSGLKSDLLLKRPDILASFSALQKADTRIAIAIADRYPRFSFSASYKRNGADLASILDNWLSNLALNLTMPIIDADKNRLEVKKNKNRYQQALMRYRQKLLGAAKEVEDALNNESHQAKYLDSLKKQLHLSQQATEQIKNNYINGAMDFQRVLMAVITDQNLERNLIKAKRQLIEYRINLYRALAGSWINNEENHEAS